MLLLFNAGPVNVSFADADDRVTAIMECFFPGQVTGDAIRHTLLNDIPEAVPSGRLPYTWPMFLSQVKHSMEIHIKFLTSLKSLQFLSKCKSRYG